MTDRQEERAPTPSTQSQDDPTIVPPNKRARQKHDDPLGKKSTLAILEQPELLVRSSATEAKSK